MFSYALTTEYLSNRTDQEGYKSAIEKKESPISVKEKRKRVHRYAI